MNCPNCGKENSDDNWVCGHCGEPLSPSDSQAQPGESGQPGPPPSGQPPLGPYDYGPEDLSPGAAQYFSEKPPSPPAPVKRDSTGVLIKLLILVLVIAGAGAAVWFFHFRSPDTSSPKGTMEAYIKAVRDADCEKFFEMTPNRLTPASGEDMNGACAGFNVISIVDIKDYKTLEEKINGDSATVKFQVTLQLAGQSIAEETTANLIREDGRWKVDPTIEW